MRIGRLKKLAEWLEIQAECRTTPPGEVMFDMGTWRSENEKAPEVCGTAACIGGSAELLFNPPTMFRVPPPSDPDDVPAIEIAMGKPRVQGENQQLPDGWKSANDLLGLSPTQSHDLFYMYNSDRFEVDDVAGNAAWAARVVRRLIKTKKVDWDAEYIEGEEV